MRAAKALANLRIGTDSPEHSLFDNAIGIEMSCAESCTCSCRFYLYQKLCLGASPHPFQKIILRIPFLFISNAQYCSALYVPTFLILSKEITNTLRLKGKLSFSAQSRVRLRKLRNSYVWKMK